MIPKSEEIKKYSGEPLVYLDQNVLDNLNKGRLPSLLSNLKASDFQIVYSDETLNEIRRAGETSSAYSNQFLQLLTNLNAVHIRINLNPDFSVTDELILTTINPFDVYERYCNGEKVYEDLMASMMLMPFKINGGSVSFDEIKNEQLKVFDELMQHLDSLADEIEEESPDIARTIKAQRDESMKHFTEVLDTMFNQIQDAVENENDWSGLNEFRNAIKLQPHHFNTIQKPNLLEQIWEKVKAAESIAQSNFTIEEFFGLMKHPVYPERSYYAHEKVTAIYSYLNMIGFHPDKPLHKERGFIRANSDLRHASIASLTHFLISCDDRFVKKVEAAYEFLGVQTEVLLVKSA